MDKNHEIQSYAAAYRGNYGFEAVMVGARQRLLRELISQLRPKVVVEVGCGTELLCNTTSPEAHAVTHWVIVEPSSGFAQHAREHAQSSRVEVVEAFLEDSVGDVLRTCEHPPDLVICSSLLHEVSDPDSFLAAAREVAGRGLGKLHVNVPNALSLHRRLARTMGLINTEYDLTDRNKQLQQTRVFDAYSLRSIVEAARFRIFESGGYFLKPFTHAQMRSLPFLTPDQLDGLWQLGWELPELASEIFVNAEVWRR